MMFSLLVSVAFVVACQAQSDPALIVYQTHMQAIPHSLRQTLGDLDPHKIGLAPSRGATNFSVDRTIVLLKTQAAAISNIVDASRAPTLGVEPLPAVFLGSGTENVTRAKDALWARRLLIADAGRAWVEKEYDITAFRLAAAVRICAQQARGPSLMDGLSAPGELWRLIGTYAETGRLSTKGKLAIRRELERLDQDDPTRQRELWYGEFKRGRAWAADLLRGPDGPRRWNDLIQEHGIDEDKLQELEARLLQRQDVKNETLIIDIWRLKPVKYKGYSATSLKPEEIETKLALADKLARQLYDNWSDSSMVREVIIKASDDDRSQIIRVLVVHGLNLPEFTESDRRTLQETLAKLELP